MLNYDGLFNKDYFGDKLNENHFSAKKLHFRIIGNGTILPCAFTDNGTPLGGIIDSNGVYLKRTFFNHLGGAYIPNELQYLNQTVIYLGTLSVSWGHCITDSLRWLWFLKSDLYKKYFKNCPIVYTVAGGGGQADTQLCTTFENFGNRHRRFKVN